MVEAIILAIIGSGALSAIVSGMFGLVASRRKSDGGIAAGVRVLLQDRIQYLGRKHVSSGEISASDFKDLMSMHAIYHDQLGGNGYLDEIMDKVKDLEMK